MILVCSPCWFRSHLVNVPATANQLSDALMTSPIIGASGSYSAASAGGGGGGAHGDFDFGVDPSQDPELAMVGVGNMYIQLCRLSHFVHCHFYQVLPFV